MKNKFFEEVDFSDVKEELTKTKVTAAASSSITLPSPLQLKNLFNEISQELNKLEAGTSNLRRGAVKFSGAAPAKEVLMRIFAKVDWTEKSLEELVSIIKQDYGFGAARWVAEKLSPYHPNLQEYLLNQQGG